MNKNEVHLVRRLDDDRDGDWNIVISSEEYRKKIEGVKFEYAPFGVDEDAVQSALECGKKCLIDEGIQEIVPLYLAMEKDGQTGNWMRYATIRKEPLPQEIEVQVYPDPEYDESKEMDRINGQFFVRMLLIPNPDRATGRQLMESPFRHKTRESAQEEALQWAKAVNGTPYQKYDEGFFPIEMEEV